MIGSALHSVLNSYPDSENKKIPALSRNEVLALVDKQLASGELPVSEKKCPECRRYFSVISIETLELDCCTYCKSIWFDAGELKAMTKLSRDVPSDDLVHRSSKYNCPVCGKSMRECVYKSPDNLLVDKCPEEHGVYLESGELKRVFESS